MFERFTQAARAVVVGAAGHAGEAGAARVTEEHLLAALLDREGTKGSFVLAALGLGTAREKARLLAGLAEARRRGGLSRGDETALASLGIDLTEVVSRIEEAHGEGAFAAGETPRRKGERHGHIPFSDGAKTVLERSLRSAVARRDRTIGDEHLLLALASSTEFTGDTLADHGVTPEAISRVLDGAPGGERTAG